MRPYRLFARPSFFEGLARLWDWGGSLNTYNEDRTPAQADAAALWDDWNAVGEDFAYATAHAPRPRDER